IMSKKLISAKAKLEDNSSSNQFVNLDFNFVFSLIIISLFVQVIGIYISSFYINSALQFNLVNNNPNSIWNAIAIILYIFFVTFLILILRKFFKKHRFLILLEVMCFFSCLLLLFETFLIKFYAYVLTIILLLIKYFVIPKLNNQTITIWYNNILLSLAIAVSGSLIGISLGFIPIIFFLIVLSLYDVFAVFYSRHMVALAKVFIKQKLSFTFLLKSKEKVFQLGGGDLVIPLVVSSSLFSILIKYLPLGKIIFILFLVYASSIFGILWTFYIIKNSSIRAMPALPMQTILIVIVILSVYLIL
ncbi:MAG: presenilin family intramembrane aspartyl protease, partial [archaeon]